MITNSQTHRTVNHHPVSQAPQTSSNHNSSAPGTRLVVRKVRRHRVRDREVYSAPQAVGNSMQTQSQYLLTKASVSFAQTDSAKQVAQSASTPSDLRFKQAAAGYTECLYKQLLYNKNDSSTDYTLGHARRLAEATRQLLDKERKLEA